MNVLIDIIHPADINVYKKTIHSLIDDGHHVTLSVLDRGSLIAIVQQEFPHVRHVVLGIHQKNIFLKIFALMLRSVDFISFFSKERFDVVSSFGFYPGLVAWMFNIPTVNMHDDKEYVLNYFLTRLTATRFLSFVSTTESDSTRVVDSFKELAYLPKKKISLSSRLKTMTNKKPFVYVREIANISVNYADEERIDYSSTFSFLLEHGYEIIFHSEDGITHYGDVHLLNIPLASDELFALEQHATLILTSGDTVLREGALLGTPTIYTSSRDMLINKQLFEKGLCQKALSSDDLLQKTRASISAKHKDSLKKKAFAFAKEKEDINKILLEEITHVVL